MFDQIPSEILSVIVSPYLQAGCAKHPRMRIIRAVLLGQRIET